MMTATLSVKSLQNSKYEHLTFGWCFAGQDDVSHNTVDRLIIADFGFLINVN